MMSYVRICQVTKEQCQRICDENWPCILANAEVYSINTTLRTRGNRYGDFTDNATVSQSLKKWLWAQNGWTKLDPVKREALEMIAQKMARILNGDPEYKDNWHDIAGYATLAEERCNETTEAKL